VRSELGQQDKALPLIDEAIKDYRELLSKLPEVLSYEDDLSLAEIAEAMDVPLGTVKSRIHTALSVLRQDPRTKILF